MNAAPSHVGWRIVVAAGAISVIATGCGTEVAPTQNDIGGATKTSYAPRNYDNRARMDFGDPTVAPAPEPKSRRYDNTVRMDFGNDIPG